MKRVLHVVHRMGYGGIETFIMNIYKNIDTTKVQFDFAVHTTIPGEYDEEIKKMGGNIYYFSSRGNNPFKYYKDWNSFLKKNSNKYNTIHMHVSSLTSILPIKLAKKYKIKNRLIHAHSTQENGLIHKVLSFFHKKNVSKYVTNLIACSTEAGNYVFGNNKFNLMNNGIIVKNYVFDIEKRNKIRKTYNLKNKDTAYVHVGRFCYAKNHQFLIKIFNEINKSNPNCKLFLIGDGELKNDIENQIKELKLTDKIILLGSRNDVSDLLQAMDMFIFPSNYEGLPLAMIEAQATGIPIYASKNISPESKISNLVTFISLEKSPKEWAKKILNNKISRMNNTADILKKAGYDILVTAKKLYNIYYN